MTPHLWKLEYNRNRQGKQLVYVSYILMFYNFNLYLILFIVSNNYCCNLIYFS
jgi:hypothetical protein